MDAGIPTEQVLHVLKKGLGPVVLRVFHERFGPSGSLGEIQKILQSRNNGYTPPEGVFESTESLLREIDAYGLLWLMEYAWQNRVWVNDLDKENQPLARSYVNELFIHRHNWAHHRLQGDDSNRMADTAARLLEVVGATPYSGLVRDLIAQYPAASNELTLYALPFGEENTDLITPYTSEEYTIQIVLDDGQTKQYTVEKDRIIVGRSQTNSDLIIGDRRVSRVHLLLVKMPDNTLTVTDLRSGNGTQFENKELKPNVPAVWPVGTMVTIGDTRLILRRG
ncbi:MAG: FHA domain-containing protein [Anaerolineaceae bacterium]|nr:FHA domain-containing protein [Anaerolineaceae bacterium]